MKTRDDFDSYEELWFYSWLKEAEKYRLVRNIKYKTVSFELAPRASVKELKQLKTKTKEVDKFLFHKHKYEPDFSFSFASDVLKKYFMCPNIGMHMGSVLVDTKGGFNRFGGSREFAINQKWMWQRFQIYVEKVVPEKLFFKTWCPEVCRLSPKLRKPVKKYLNTPTICDFLGGSCGK